MYTHFNDCEYFSMQYWWHSNAPWNSMLLLSLSPLIRPSPSLFWGCRAQEIKWAPWISFQFYFFFSSFLVPSFSWILVSPHLGHLTAVEAKHIGRRHMGICIHIPYISTATPPLSDRPFRCQWQASVCIEMCAFKMHSDSFWFPLLWEKLFNDCMTL